MSIKIEANGRRSMELAFDVEATPEQVWQAIATGGRNHRLTVVAYPAADPNESGDKA